MDEAKSNSILVVDDDILCIMILKEILRPEYTFYAARNGRNAIKIAEKKLPDVILLDISMPEIDGYAVFAALKDSEKTRDIPVIFISGHSDAENEEKALFFGASDYIKKPFNSEIVKLRVQNQIKVKKQKFLLLEKKLAEMSSRIKIEFLSRMNNEMLTHMNTIMGMTHMLKMSDSSDDTKEYLEEIDVASRHLLRLINDLLDVSGKRDNAFIIANSVFNFNNMFREILKKIGRDVTQKRQTLNFDIDPSIPMFLYGDEKRFSKVIANLLTNASKFTPENGEIHFSAYVLSKDSETITLQIEITDNGIGIPKEKQNDIFNVFELVDGSVTSEYGGVGLGLSISKHFVEMMGGKIWVDSELDKGSKFAFTCKLHKNPPSVTGNL